MVVPTKAEILRHRDSCQRLADILLFAYRPVHSPKTAFDPLAPISFTLLPLVSTSSPLAPPSSRQFPDLLWVVWGAGADAGVSGNSCCDHNKLPVVVVPTAAVPQPQPWYNSTHTHNAISNHNKNYCHHNKLHIVFVTVLYSQVLFCYSALTRTTWFVNLNDIRAQTNHRTNYFLKNSRCFTPRSHNNIDHNKTCFVISFHHRFSSADNQMNHKRLGKA